LNPFLQQITLMMTPKTSALISHIRRSEGWTRSLMRSKKAPGSMFCQSTATRYAPAMPAIPNPMASSGSISVVASTRGTTRYCTGLTPSW